MRRKLLKFLILFDNTSLLYFPGQFLSGRVLIELQDDTPALGKNVRSSDEFSILIFLSLTKDTNVPGQFIL